MKRPSFLEGVGVAFAAALVAGLGLPALFWLLPTGEAMRLLVTGLSGAYLAYLLVRSSERVGRSISLTLWLLMTGALWVIAPALSIHILAHLGLLSLLRALYFHATPLSALVDLGLTGLSLIAALGAYLHTGSAFLTVWCLFLVQALFVLIPTGGTVADGSPREDAFDRAHRNAEAALRKLAADHRS